MSSLPLATIPATEARIVKARAIDQEYVISVALPYHYDENPDKTYPVIYVLDGSWYFGMVVDMVRIMNFRVSFCDELPDAIVVGIGYPNGKTLIEKQAQACHRRLRDFNPLRNEESEAWHYATFPLNETIRSGGGEQFLAFVKDELLPLIESEYRADPTNRCLLGHSSGGKFALYALFTFPTLFQKYVIASPAESYETEPWFTENTVNLSARIYLSSADRELEYEEHGVERFQRLARVLTSKMVGEHQLIEQMFVNNTHCAVAAPAFQAGLVAVLP